MSGVSRVTPLNESDASFIYLAQPGESWSIQMEVHLAGRLEPERLLSAARAACERHPLARARLAPFRARDRVYRWEIQDEVSLPVLEVLDYTDERDLARIRDRYLSEHPSLNVTPPFRILLLHGPGGDVLIFNVHHAAYDGLSALRILTSMFRAYAGIEHDPVPDFDPLRARELRPLVVPEKLRERLARLRRLPALLAEGKRPSASIAPRMEAKEPGRQGIGFCLLSFDKHEIALINAHRRGSSTMNDVMLGALALAIRRWNAKHEAETGRISVMVPVNVRPKAWAAEVLGNFASYIPVSVAETVPDDLDELIAAVTQRTQWSKRHHTASAMFDLLTMFLRLLPVGLKERWKSRVQQTREELQDTALFSNLGRYELPDLGGAAGAARAVWISPPVRFTRGFGIGVVSLPDSTHISLRYHRALFDEASASAFAQLYRDILLAEQPGSYSSTTSVSPSLTA